jgi:hypothetical protein
MHTLKFQLTQHTPLIHFHAQEDATLRATEMKPKLDKYLIKIMGGQEEVNANYQGWLIPGQKSFDFKVRISATPARHDLIPEGPNNRIPFYFGNMGDDYRRNPKYLSFSDDPVEVSVITFNSNKVGDETLVEYIRSVIPAFFLSENFGTRQSKGYGSFYIHEQDELYETPETCIAFQNEGSKDFLPYSFTLQTAGNDFFSRSRDALSKTEVFYKAMRSGINKCFGGGQHYVKSLLWLYFKRVVNTDIKWEKKKIKEMFLSTHPETVRQPGTHSSKPGYAESPLGSAGTHEILIKDLFGLASEETWEARYNSFKIEKVIEGIDRLKSPVFFKPLKTGNKYKVFFHAHELTTDNSVVRRTVQINGSLNINTPAAFDFHRFFDFLSNPAVFNLDNHMLVQAMNEDTNVPEFMRVADIKRQGTREHERVDNYRILNSIINELQSHKNA